MFWFVAFIALATGASVFWALVAAFIITVAVRLALANDLF
jgi:hypothetical protein